MNRITIILIAGLSVLLGVAVGCSPGASSDNAAPAGNARTGTNANTAAATPAATHKVDDETPGEIKAAFPKAQSFSKQHKDIPQGAITDIEKETGGKVPETDHHSYLAFSIESGTRKQLGAATQVNAAGKDIVVIYESKEGSPFIKEVRAEGLPEAFLAQFAGKGHDDKLSVGAEIKAGGVDEVAAKAIATAIWVDVLTMQALYGAAHTH